MGSALRTLKGERWGSFSVRVAIRLPTPGEQLQMLQPAFQKEWQTA